MEKRCVCGVCVCGWGGGTAQVLLMHCTDVTTLHQPLFLLSHHPFTGALVAPLQLLSDWTAAVPGVCVCVRGGAVHSQVTDAVAQCQADDPVPLYISCESGAATC